MINEAIIKNWGAPEFIKDRNIEFIFSNNNLNSDLRNNKIIEDLGCYDNRAKFCLYDKENNKIILTMNFIIFGMNKNPIFEGREKEIQLTCLCTNDFEIRKKGISGYYLEKLIEFGIANNINNFKLSPNPYNEIFKDLNQTDALDLEKLKKFYIKKFDNLGFSYEYSGENNTILEFKKLQK